MNVAKGDVGLKGFALNVCHMQSGTADCSQSADMCFFLFYIMCTVGYVISFGKS
jgi:hypothetical protein